MKPVKQNRSTSYRRRGAKHPRDSARSGQRGIALLTVLLILSVLSILGLVMAVTANSDMMINGYYGNYRGSFYAADSGVNIARAALANQLAATVSTAPCTGWVSNSTGACAAAPLPSTATTTALNYVNTNYGSFTSLNTGQASTSWPESFEIANTANCTNSLAVASGFPTTALNSQGQISSYTYHFNYTLCAIGRAGALQQVSTKDMGNIVVTIQAQTSTSTTTTTSFAAFGAFVNNYPPCLGALIPGTMSGPMFTNGAWQFMTGGAYIFTDPVGQANAKADYWFGSQCIQSATSSYTKNGQTINPAFQGGLNLGQAPVNLPPNDFSQRWAVLDGKGCGEGGTTCGSSTPPNPTAANLNAVLRDVNGNPYPTNGTPPGVYLPYCTGGATCASPNTVTGGGIYVEGNASVQMSLGTDALSHPTQIFNITQGGTTTTITINPGANTTTMTTGASTVTLAGVPQNLAGSTPQAGTMLYVDGAISGLSGTGQGIPAVQDGQQITIAANGNINITGDVLYNHEPVTLNTADTLIPANDTNQVLGIFTASGNINLQSKYSNSNLEVDGSLAAIGQSCPANSCGFTVTGSINTFNNVGGQIQSNIFSANMQTENTYFDRRFTSKPGFAPPWFPSTTVPSNDITNALPPLVSVLPPQRTTWVTYPQ